MTVITVEEGDSHQGDMLKCCGVVKAFGSATYDIYSELSRSCFEHLKVTVLFLSPIDQDLSLVSAIGATTVQRLVVAALGSLLISAHSQSPWLILLIQLLTRVIQLLLFGVNMNAVNNDHLLRILVA